MDFPEATDLEATIIGTSTQDATKRKSLIVVVKKI